ncbi:ABC-2 transporter permease [Butyricicoccus porcorum]|uniref:ABC-2 transporter permease n=1 Tax=Butyricicoccus porcorum TaxID=1945634 RepID=A0A252F6X0_9FIRM|nr:ABC-2 transporter permease [Butyricicoccus porcorum]OUM21511.1 hypothetical protein CBW42_02780 [Butyricicoccus porcorum]
MTGLIKYDLLQICSGVKGGFVALYLVFMAVLGIVNDVGSMFSYIFVFVSAMFGIASFSYEENYHWNRYTASLPVSVRQLVLARYGSVSICVAAGIVASALLGIISFVAGHAAITGMDWLLMLIQSMLCAVLYMEILIPMMYRFGAEKGRIVMLILFVALFAALSVVGTIAEEATMEQAAALELSMKYITMGSAAVVFALLPVSVSASVRIRAKKEF